MNCQSDVEQLDLFGGADLSPQPDTAAEVLNGVYYEASTGLFVSFVLGRRHYEWSEKGCTFDRDWQERVKRERAI
ncbi:hypothetical protein J41TS12_50370 [Paenibacillus antibioticophila]|uniref:Uncharacterized protein n=1 Tax=Paenibacillus antibioticophila TaxID=1274374 RepID=A0A919XVQ7_9BACL|nr:hypothetical protein [Paenibacillus antibioticophila]GIO40176.1 hypothetical protein J41TS12_50370 [Paenibacillus antibioticophila]